MKSRPARSRRFHATAACAVLLALAGARVAPQSREQTPEFRVAVNFVRVDVIVADKKGQPPADLRAEDFRVYEDGVLQQIQSFETTSAGASTSPASAPYRRDSAIVLLVIDNLNSRWANLAQMNDAVEGFLSQSLGPHDLVGIVSVSHAPRLVQNFTTNRKA